MGRSPVGSPSRRATVPIDRFLPEIYEESTVCESATFPGGNEMKSSVKRIAMLITVLLMAALVLAVHAEDGSDLAAGVSVTAEQTEVLYADGVCNVPMHGVWRVLFFASLALNAAAVVVIVVLIWKKKHVLKDDIPLVDYDIDYDSDNIDM